jgi:ectoine hydroxylase-related dioxygenase (phytanoyl-CoA dioxygenase family)
MDWIVTASASETAGGELSPETESAAHAAFREHGCVLLRGAFPLAAIEAMHRDYVALYGTLDFAAMEVEAAKPPPNRFLMVGDARYDIVLRMTGAFGRTEVFANARLLKVLGPLLGSDIHLSNFTVAVSHPGARQQHTHRDNAHLFSDPGVGPNLPIYAINVAVPLIDVDIETGPTGVWLGSHRLAQGASVQSESMTACSLQRGDCMLLDYRTMHAGLPNLSRRARPIVYMVYARPWFFDHVNHITRIPLDMPLDHYNKLPESARRLLIRAFSYASRTRWHEADARGRAGQRNPNDLSSLGKVGRNDPCPCGSGKKHKHCHGQSA